MDRTDQSSQLPHGVQVQQLDGGPHWGEGDWLLLPGEQTDGCSMSQVTDMLGFSNCQPVSPASYVDLVVTAVRLSCKLYVQLRNMQGMLYELIEAMAEGIQVCEEGELRPQMYNGT